jgi:hypothetical protein
VAASRAWSRTRSGGAAAVRPKGWVVLMVSTPLVAVRAAGPCRLWCWLAVRLTLPAVWHGVSRRTRSLPAPVHGMPSGAGEVPQMATRGSGLETW